MFTKVKLGAAIVGVGWMGLMAPAIAHAQPPRIPPGNNDNCANLAGTNFVADPDDANAYYVCVDGAALQHLDCPLPGATSPDIPGPCIRAVPGRLPQGNAHAKP
jgi:hypothetical protein